MLALLKPACVAMARHRAATICGAVLLCTGAGFYMAGPLRNSACELSCAGTFKNVGLALLNYHDANGRPWRHAHDKCGAWHPADGAQTNDTFKPEASQPVEKRHRGVLQHRQARSESAHGSQNNDLRRHFSIAPLRYCSLLRTVEKINRLVSEGERGKPS